MTGCKVRANTELVSTRINGSEVIVKLAVDVRSLCGLMSDVCVGYTESELR